MLTFKGFLITEGGNVKIGDSTATTMKITPQNRSHVAGDAHEFLHGLHNSFHKETGKHLFGKNAKALNTGSTFSGSTHHLFDKNISDEEFAKHKKEVGDLDVKVPREHMDALHAHLQPGKKIGKYTVIGVKKGPGEHHALISHINGENHQVDFEASDYDKDEPSKFDQFSHSSNWEDVKMGVKGYHHKILLNAAGRDKHKFSIMYGHGSREGDANWHKDIGKMNTTLFGKDANEGNMHSFHGLVQNIKHHVPNQYHQEIYDKFKDATTKAKGINSRKALEHMRNNLVVKDDAPNPEDQVHHTSVVPMAGFAPSHMGHAADLGETLKKLPGTKHVGISGKFEAFTPAERKKLLEKQWGSGTKAHIIKGAGESIRAAHDSLPSTGKKVLHMVVGHDRKSFAEGLKKSLEAGKIKEMEGHKFDDIQIHYPEDTDRSHGMSGTKMRHAAHEGNIEEFHRHLGPMFSRKEATAYMNKVKKGIDTGTVPLKR